MFSPVESAIGALLIQCATTSYIWHSGKVIGFSSLINGIFDPNVENVSIVSGIIMASLFVAYKIPDFSPIYQPVASVDLLEHQVDTSFPLYVVVSGLLVGAGTKFGCGCTSGHFLAGVSRLRLRSIIATAVFVIVGIVTVKIAGNGAVCYTETSNGEIVPTNCYVYDENFSIFQNNKMALLSVVFGGICTSYILIPILAKVLVTNGGAANQKTSSVTNSWFLKYLTGVNAGFLFGLGLFISGMVNPTKTIGFLSILTPSRFDPSLMLIAIFAILPNIVIWKKSIPQTKSELQVKKPLLTENYSLNFSNTVDLKFLFGNVLFGVGWGLYGVCPGPGLIGALGFNQWDGVYWLMSFLAGSWLAKKLN
ncbi:hypothetical protein DASC09_025350 [Saccharomycopsis crataegensis]|uniref:Sulphur transport domain-containing protein n=1 Tax=Saccharomycopsis crataegensis TaxID=43959 RepID=A0AAV5QLJ2_9ASCO|nr:hypothetical protein DASC09_025350 [Saccharomycopsis crataegensis]